MVRELDKRWNRFYPDILRLQQELVQLGLEYYDGEVHYGDPAGQFLEHTAAKLAGSVRQDREKCRAATMITGQDVKISALIVK